MRLTEKEFLKIKNNEQDILLLETGNFKEELLSDIEYEVKSYDNIEFDIEHMKKDKFKIWLFDEFNEFLGTIIINGYQVIKNPFNNKTNNYFYQITKELSYNLDILNNFKTEIIQDFASYKNRNWIYSSWNLLKEFFENQEEILILKIEIWEE